MKFVFGLIPWTANEVPLQRQLRRLRLALPVCNWNFLSIQSCDFLLAPLDYLSLEVSSYFAHSFLGEPLLNSVLTVDAASRPSDWCIIELRVIYFRSASNRINVFIFGHVRVAIS